MQSASLLCEELNVQATQFLQQISCNLKKREGEKVGGRWIYGKSIYRLKESEKTNYCNRHHCEFK